MRILSISKRGWRRCCLMLFAVPLVFTLYSCSSLQTGGGSEKTIVDSAAVRNTLSQALSAMDQQDVETADAAFKLMLDQGARSPNSLNHYAIFLREQWRMEEAESIYLHALKYSPRDAMTHYNVGILYEIYLGKQASALEHYRRYQSLVDEPDKQVAAWISALERRIGSSEAVSEGDAS